MTTAVAIAPTPILQFFDNRGVPCAGGTVLTQVGGVNYATYQDSAGATPLPNPVPLNNRGEVSNTSGASCQMFLAIGVTYTFTLYDSGGNQINQAAYVSSPSYVLTSDLAGTASNNGAGLVGLNTGVTYSAGTVGAALAPLALAFNILTSGAVPHVGLGVNGVSSSQFTSQVFTSRDGTGIGSAVQFQRYWDTDVSTWTGNRNTLRALAQVGPLSGTTVATVGDIYAVSGEVVMNQYATVSGGSATAIAGTITTAGANAQSICAAFQVRDTSIPSGNPYPAVGMEINMPIVGADSATANNGFGNRYLQHLLARTDYTNFGSTGWAQGFTGVGIMMEHTVGAVSSTDGPGAFNYGIVVRDNLNYQTIVNAGSFVIGTQYTICVPGTTTFTAIGAANNNQGTTFTATGAGSGSGTACQGPGPLVNDAIRVETWGQTGIRVSGGNTTAAILLDVASATYGPPAFGLICNAQYGSGTAIRIPANIAIGFEASNSVRMLYNSGNGHLEFYNGATLVGHLVVTGGSDHAI